MFRLWHFLPIYTSIVSGLISCNNNSKHLPRPVLIKAFDETAVSIKQGSFTEQERRKLDSIIAANEPLNKEELLRKYDIYQWYYIEFCNREYKKADNIADSALLLLSDKRLRKQLPDEYTKWLFYKGDILIRLKRLNEAFLHYYEAKEHVDSKWDNCKKYRFSGRLANVRYLQENYEDAKHYFKQSFLENQRCKTTDKEAKYYRAVTEPQGQLNGIALCFERQNQADSALYYYQKALSFLLEKSKKFPEYVKLTEIANAVIYGNIGGTLAKMRRYEQAEHYLKESIRINSRPSYDNRDAVTAQIKLAKLYVNTHQFAQAERWLKKSRTAIDSLPNESLTTDLKQATWKYEQAAGSPATALAALQAYHQYKDSLNEIDRTTLGIDFVNVFKLMEQDKRLHELTFKNNANFILLIVFVICLLLTCTIIYLILHNYKKSRRHVDKLKNLNEKIHERNEKLQLSFLALQESQQDNTRIIAMVAHDLKGPVGNIKMAIQLLTMDRLNTEENRIEFLDMIEKSTDQALYLVDDLMYSYRKDSHQNGNLFNMEDMVNDCVELMKLRADEKNQTISTTTRPMFFYGNGEKLWRIISNLIINAIKFTPRQGHIQVNLSQHSNKLAIEVIDNGIGIPQDQLKKLFDMTHTSGREGTDGETSTGMGLAIVNQIVSSYHGKIEVSSQEGQGTTFRVWLPTDQDIIQSSN